MTENALEKAAAPFTLSGRPLITLCNYEIHDDVAFSKVTPTLEAISKYSIDKKQIQIFLNLKVIATSDSGTEIFKIAINVYSLFIYDGAEPAKELEQFAKLNGPAIVYPFLRSALFNLCFASGVQPITLPIINFLKFPVIVEQN